MQPSEADGILKEPQRKRKLEEIDGVEIPAEETETSEPIAEKTKCPCPICGCLLFEEDINPHLDICLNRSTVLEMIRESDKNPTAKPPTVLKPLPKNVQLKGGRPAKKKR